jgi:prepilin-type processing-associated H-X9-DG protein
LNDSQCKRYTYASLPGGTTQLIAPLPAAIAPYLSAHRLDYSNWNTLDQQLNDSGGIWRMFMCPMTDALERHRIHPQTRDTTPTGQGTMVVIAGYMWATNTDFAVNEGVFGFDYRSQYVPRRLAGNLVHISRPCETMLFCDANIAPQLDPMIPPSFPYPWIMMSPTLDPESAPGPVTLADVLEGNPKVVANRAVIDPQRHRGRMNVVFADGHVESTTIGVRSLQRVLLSAR